MPARTVHISIEQDSKPIKHGAIRGQDIIDLASLASGEQLFLEIPSDVDIPVSPADIIFIRGGESFSIGDGQPRIPDNPRVRKPAPFTLNDTSISADQRSPHAKLTGAELKQLAGSDNVDLWADLEGIADEILADSDYIIVQANDVFFTVPRDEEDRFYEVTVILDGEDRQVRFPAMMKVQEATRRSLPPRDRPQVNDFDMADGDVGTSPLNPDITLKEAGVRDGHVLSITKKNGGGG